MRMPHTWSQMMQGKWTWSWRLVVIALASVSVWRHQKKPSTCCRSRIPCVVVKIWHVDVKTAASSWKKITVHEPLLGASITVRLWSFTRILDLSRIYCAAKRRSPPGSINGHGWNWWGWCGVYIPGAGVAGILNTYTHGVVRWWRLSITSKKPVSANGL